MRTSLRVNIFTSLRVHMCIVDGATNAQKTLKKMSAYKDVATSLHIDIFSRTSLRVNIFTSLRVHMCIVDGATNAQEILSRQTDVIAN